MKIYHRALGCVLTLVGTGCGGFWSQHLNHPGETASFSKVAADYNWIVTASHQGFRFYGRPNTFEGIIVPYNKNTDSIPEAGGGGNFTVNTVLPSCFADPSIVKDPLTGRWFASALGIASDGSTAWVCVGVSRTDSPSPLNGWDTWAFFGPPVLQGTAGAANFSVPDAPQLGFGQDNVVVTGVPLPVGAGGQGALLVAHSIVFIINKADLIAGNRPRFQTFVGGHDENRLDLLTPSIQITGRANNQTHDVYLPAINRRDSLNSHIRLYGVRGIAPEATFEWIKDEVLPDGNRVRWPYALPQPTSVRSGPAVNGGVWISGTDVHLQAASLWFGHLITVLTQGCFPNQPTETSGNCLRVFQWTTHTYPGQPYLTRDEMIGARGDYYGTAGITFTPGGDILMAAMQSSWRQFLGLRLFGIAGTQAFKPVIGPYEPYRQLLPASKNDNFDYAPYGSVIRWGDTTNISPDYRSLHGAYATTQLTRADTGWPGTFVQPVSTALVDATNN